jgi:hypothetical protein
VEEAVKNLYVASPCGHGKLVDVVPLGDFDDGSSQTWGLITVILKDGETKPRQCCSHSEGEFGTEEDARRAAEHEKRYQEKQLNEALAVLEGASRTVWTLARVTIADLVALRDKLAQNLRRACEAPLCFEEGAGAWLVDEEEERCLCDVHLKGKKIQVYGRAEVVFESWEQITELRKKVLG